MPMLMCAWGSQLAQGLRSCFAHARRAASRCAFCDRICLLWSTAACRWSRACAVCYGDLHCGAALVECLTPVTRAMSGSKWSPDLRMDAFD